MARNLRFLGVVIILAVPHFATATIIDITIDGSDAIFLAGRSDIIVPAANQPWTSPPADPDDFLARHPAPTPEEIQETHPDSVAVSAGDVIRVADPAVGGVNFFNGFGPPFFGPGGNGVAGSNLDPLGGISGYLGPEGPLTGVFLDDSVPDSGPAPMTLDFTPGGLGTDFLSLTPELGQVFYIGDGVTGGGDFQDFIAPVGATRLFLGIPDGFSFDGHPGAYDDNDGAYRVRIGINETPRIPAPSTLFLMVAGLLGAAVRRRAGTS